MPWTTMDDVPANLKGIDPPITLAQANLIARWADGMEDADNPWAAAISQFKEQYSTSDDGWIKKSMMIAKDMSLDEHSSMVRNAWYAVYAHYEDDEYPAADFWVKEVFWNYLIVEAPSGLLRYPYVMTATGISFGDGELVEHTYVTKSQDAIEYFVPILKSDEERHLVYGVALKPDFIDKQSDTISDFEIEKTAHNWMVGSRKMDLEHKEVLSSNVARPVESYIAPLDFELNGATVQKGSWVVVTHIPDDEVWEKVKNGELNGYSIRGVGTRKEVQP